MGAKDEDFRGLGLTSRRNLCLHPEVSKEKKGKVVDSRCRDLTSAFACEKGRAEPGSVPLCSFHEVSLFRKCSTEDEGEGDMLCGTHQGRN